MQIQRWTWWRKLLRSSQIWMRSRRKLWACWRRSASKSSASAASSMPPSLQLLSATAWTWWSSMMIHPSSLITRSSHFAARVLRSWSFRPSTMPSQSYPFCCWMIIAFCWSRIRRKIYCRFWKASSGMESYSIMQKMVRPSQSRSILLSGSL